MATPHSRGSEKYPKHYIQPTIVFRKRPYIADEVGRKCHLQDGLAKTCWWPRSCWMRGQGAFWSCCVKPLPSTGRDIKSQARGDGDAWAPHPYHHGSSERGNGRSISLDEAHPLQWPERPSSSLVRLDLHGCPRPPMLRTRGPPAARMLSRPTPPGRGRIGYAADVRRRKGGGLERRKAIESRSAHREDLAQRRSGRAELPAPEQPAMRHVHTTRCGSELAIQHNMWRRVADSLESALYSAHVHRHRRRTSFEIHWTPTIGIAAMLASPNQLQRRHAHAVDGTFGLLREISHHTQPTTAEVLEGAIGILQNEEARFQCTQHSSADGFWRVLARRARAHTSKSHALPNTLWRSRRNSAKRTPPSSCARPRSARTPTC